MERLHFDLMIGESRGMQSVFEQVEMASTSDTTVLIEGETGTGKELVARAIHKRSGGNGRRFIAVNCTAIPKELFESELFGHEKGAFTSANTSRIGKLELARDGSLLLDEVGDMDGGIQAKLLRVLEEREFNRVGGNTTIKLRSRIIATTNRSLLERVDEGSFRDDLYYRLSEFTIHLPPLRERKEDIPHLVSYFLRVFGVREDVVSGDAMDLLMEHEWPGNVRELKNVLKKAIIKSKGSRIRREDVDLSKRMPTNGSQWLTLPHDITLREAERMIIKRMLELHNNDKRKVARILGVSLATIYNKMRFP
jgi:transcriptional regulator with PAS, ATPase and Fis domain